MFGGQIREPNFTQGLIYLLSHRANGADQGTSNGIGATAYHPGTSDCVKLVTTLGSDTPGPMPGSNAHE